MIVSGFAVGIINFMDTVFLGHVSELALNISTLGGLIYFICIMVSNALGMGVQVVLSRYAGRNEIIQLVQSFNNSLVLGLLTSLLLVIFCYLVLPLIIPEMLSNNKVAEGVIGYLNYRIWAVIPAFFVAISRSFLNSVGVNKILVYGAFAMAIVNIVLNYLLIFGNYGFPEMSINGAALASGISEIAGFVIILFYLLLPIRKKYKSVLNDFKIRFDLMKSIIQIAYPLVFQFFASNIIWLLFFTLISNIGEREGAVSNILKTLFMFYLIPVWGYVQAVNSIVSNLIGQDKINEVAKYTFISAVRITLIIVPLALLNYIFASYTVSLFTENSSLIEDAVPMVQFLSLFIVIATFFTSIFNGYTGTGDTKRAVLFEMTGATLYFVYVLYFIKYKWISLEVAWSSEIVYWIFLGGISWFALNKGYWKDQINKIR